MKRSNQHSKNDYQQLESRRMLAGNVTATLTDGGFLILSGNQDDNQVLVTTNESGDVEVTGLNDTTINDTDDSFVADGVVEDLRLFLRGGDDMVSVEDVEFADRVVVRGGSGNDTIGFLRTTVGDSLRIDSGSQGDFISLDTVNVGTLLNISSRGGEDVVGIDNSEIEGRTTVRTGSRSDRLAIRNSVHEAEVRVTTSGGSDFFGVDGLSVNDSARIQLGGRADAAFINDSEFLDSVNLGGNGGSDVLEVTGETSFEELPVTISFDGDDVPGGLVQIDAVFSDLIESGARLGNIAELAAMTPQLSQLVGALEATGLDETLAGPGPFTVFAPLNSGFDAIDDVVAGLDNDELTSVLQFHVVAGEIFAEELITLESVDTVLGQSFTVDTTNGVLLNGNATLGTTDIRASNGVIHLLNDVLVPVL